MFEWNLRTSAVKTETCFAYFYEFSRKNNEFFQKTLKFLKKTSKFPQK